MTREEILIGDVDLKALEDICCNWPFLRDRRIEHGRRRWRAAHLQSYARWTVKSGQ